MYCIEVYMTSVIQLDLYAIKSSRDPRTTDCTLSFDYYAV